MTAPTHRVLDREHAHVRRRLVRTQTRLGDLTLLVGTWHAFLYDAGEDDPAYETEERGDG